ncbi:MAG: hypothetical protein P1V51_03235 [Deltaproteobacteria bacterium]|nr:hypothetical protein [Deltaproteobacteria bacterium]
MKRATQPTSALATLFLLGSSLALIPGCPRDDGEGDGGTDAGIECTPMTVEDDCQLDDGDPCTEAACIEGACVLVRRPAAMERIVTHVPAQPIEALEYHWGRLLLAEGPDGVGEYRVSIDPTSTTVTERVRYPTTGPAKSLRALNGHVLVSEGETGLEVFADGNPDAESLYLGPDPITGSAMIDTTVIAFAYAKGLDFVDYAAWTAPAPQITVDTRGRAFDAIGWNDLILVADGLAGVAVVDFTDRANPVLRPEPLIRTEGRVVALRRRGNLLGVAESGAGAGLFDLGASGGPARLLSMDLGGPVVDVDVMSRNTVLFAASDGGLTILDLLDPENPVVWIREVPEGPVLDIYRSGEQVALAMGDAGVAIYDLKCTPPDPTP